MSISLFGGDYDETLTKDGEKNKIYRIYDAYNNKKKEKVCLKVYNEENIEIDEEEDKNIFFEQIEKEGKILKEFNSDYIIKLKDIVKYNENYILSLEYFETNLYNYVRNNPELISSNYIKFYKKVVISLVYALKELKGKGIIHRNIKPENILKLESTNNSPESFNIKLANFDCAVYTKDVKNSLLIGSLRYSAPEIINKLNYDEKSDYWSLGIVLYELYFFVSPFGKNMNINKIRDIMLGKEKFIFRKSNIPTLDVLFRRLLCINPDERMSLEELIEFVENDNFLEKDQIYENKKYTKYSYNKIYESIKEEISLEYIEEYGEETLQDKKLITSVTDFLDTINYSSNSLLDGELFKENTKFNNIIYYDEINDENYKKNVYDDCDKLEESTPGAFIFCSESDQFKQVLKEIVEKIEKDYKDKNCIFNLIVSGSAWVKEIYKYVDDADFKKVIKNVCIYCYKGDDYKYLLDKYDIIKNVWDRLNAVINFINKYSNKNIQPFPLDKVITKEKYSKKYKILHQLISFFYGQYNKEEFLHNYSKIEKLINEEFDNNKLINRSKRALKNAFQKFDDKEEIEKMKSIIEEYTSETFYKDLNRWQRSLDIKYYLTTSYFSSRLVYCLNQYGNYPKKNEINKKNFYEEKEKVYRGIRLPLYAILPYKIVEKKIITLPAFTSTSVEDDIANKSAGRGKYKTQDRSDFSVFFYLTNNYKKGWVSNGIDVQDISRFNDEKEILYQAFSFYYVDKVDIDINEKKADIYLNTIGKECILEEEIKLGKEIEYNEKKNIMQIKK